MNTIPKIKVTMKVEKKEFPSEEKRDNELTKENIEKLGD